MHYILRFSLILIGFFSVHGAFAREWQADTLSGKIRTETLIFSNDPDSALKMDVYCTDNDTAGVDRPVLLYVHGGGFRAGHYNDEWIEKFCRYMAKRGVIAITMQYHLRVRGYSFDCNFPAIEKRRVFLETGRDISRAVRYIYEHAEEWNADKENIIVAGSSAGAEAGLHAVYWDETRKDDHGVILPPDFRYGGMISCAGAICDIEMIREDNAVPTQLFHGSCDKLVPYNVASHHYCDKDKPGYIVLYGGYAITQKLASMGKGYYLCSFCGGSHGWASWPIVNYRDVMLDFIFNDVVQEKKRQIHVIEKEDNDCPDKGEFLFCK